MAKSSAPAAAKKAAHSPDSGTAPQAGEKKAKKNPLVITVSELEAMDEKAQHEFRRKHGTVTNDPVEE